MPSPFEGATTFRRASVGPSSALPRLQAASAQRQRDQIRRNDDDVVTSYFGNFASSNCVAMGVNTDGQLAMIAGKDNYVLIDLNEPGRPASVARKFTKARIPECQFNYRRASMVAVAVEDRVEVVDWSEDGLCNVVTTLCYDQGFVTDVTWQEQNPNLLVTSSTKQEVVVFDIRQVNPVVTFDSQSSNGSQAIWDRFDPNVVASAQSTTIRLWDVRYPAKSTRHTVGHKDRINALDFSANRPGRIVSSSNDGTVKFWNSSDAVLTTRRVIHVPQAPVWKMRYVPFGEAVVTLSSKSLYSSENNLVLWSVHNLNSPVHTFFGHTERVMEFCWRVLPTEDGNFSAEDGSTFQMVTWSQDRHLKLWPIKKHILDKIGALEEEELDEMEKHAQEVLDDAPTDAATNEIDPEDGPIQMREPSPEKEAEQLKEHLKEEVVFPSYDRDQSTEGEEDDSSSHQKDSGIADAENKSLTPCSLQRTDTLNSIDSEAVENEADEHAASLEEEDTVPELRAVALRNSTSESGFGPEDGLSFVPMVKTRRSKSVEEAPGCEVAVPISSSIPNADMLFKMPEPKTLSEEMRELRLSDNLSVERFDELDRRLVIAVKTKTLAFRIILVFPEGYPEKEAILVATDEPSVEDTDKDKSMAKAIVSRLQRVVISSREKKRRGLALVIRSLETHVDKIRQQETNNSYVSPFHIMGSLKDSHVPFPRVSGARFCGFGKLVTFAAPPGVSALIRTKGKDGKSLPRSFSTVSNSKDSNAEELFKTPSKSRKPYSSFEPRFRRSSKLRMSSVGSSISEEVGPSSSGGSVVSFQPGQNGGGNSAPDSQQPIILDPESTKFRVHVFNVNQLQPNSLELAKGYFLRGSSPAELCSMNAGLAHSLGRANTARIWSRLIPAAQCLDLRPMTQHTRARKPCGVPNRAYSCSCPFHAQPALPKNVSGPLATVLPVGQGMVDAVVNHFLQRSDVVTAATILCIFSKPKIKEYEEVIAPHHQNGHVPRQKTSRSESQYPVDTGRDAAMEAEAFRHHRYNSESPTAMYADDDEEESASAALEEQRQILEQDKRLRELERWEADSALLSAKNEARNELVKMDYRKLLNDTGLFLHSAEVGKFIEEDHFAFYCSLTPKVECPDCEETVRIQKEGNDKSKFLSIKAKVLIPYDQPVCKLCKRETKVIVECVVCQLTVRGLKALCSLCGHGGHPNHVGQWFAERSECPSGCGCFCVGNFQ